MDVSSNKIREFRFKDEEMTRESWAERVGISRQTMNAILNWRHAPIVSVAIRIADVFQVSVDHLFALDQEDKPAWPVQPASVVTDRPRAILHNPAEVEARHEPTKKAGEQEFRLANLRDVIG